MSYPSMEWLVAVPSLTRLFIVEMILGALHGMGQGVLIISIVEIMPAEVRAALIGLIGTLLARKHLGQARITASSAPS